MECGLFPCQILRWIRYPIPANKDRISGDVVFFIQRLVGKSIYVVQSTRDCIFERHFFRVDVCFLNRSALAGESVVPNKI